MPNSLCQKVDCYHQYHMKLIIAKEVEQQIAHDTTPKWNNVLFLFFDLSEALQSFLGPQLNYKHFIMCFL